MEEHASLQPAEPVVATPASPAAAPLAPTPLLALSRAGRIRGGGASLSRAKLVAGHSNTDDDADWQKESKARQTPDHWAVDRATGGQSGFAGYTSNEQPGMHATEWNPGSPTGFATYDDRPSASIPSTDWSFETAVVGKGGADEGVIYSSCSWGFIVDENFVLTAKQPKVSDKPSGAFGAAVDKWNQQAAGPAEQRNAPNQQSLPSVR